MATRSRTTFQKRQKELARQERQRAKVTRRMERKLTKTPGLPEIEGLDENGDPLPIDDAEETETETETEASDPSDVSQ